MPFLVGVQHRTAEVRALAEGLVRVSIADDAVEGGEGLPALPRHKWLVDCLTPSYNVLDKLGRRARSQPLYAVSGIQRTAAEGFLSVRRCRRPAPPAPHPLHARLGEPTFLGF